MRDRNYIVGTVNCSSDFHQIKQKLSLNLWKRCSLQKKGTPNMPRNLSQLTKTEKDILDFLWNHGRPLSASEIINLYPNRTWKASYIHLVLNSMFKKKVIRINGFKPTGKNYARSFAPALTREAYLVHEMIRELHPDKEHLRRLMIDLVDSASDLQTVTSMLELCQQKKSQLTNS